VGSRLPQTMHLVFMLPLDIVGCVVVEVSSKLKSR
jgi:hypothetical protein